MRSPARLVRRLAAARLCGVAHATSPAPLLAVGDTLACSRAFTAADVAAFTSLTGDCNPIHSSQAAALAAGFTGCLTPGLLVASLFPALIGTRLPGSVYLTQRLSFRGTAPVGGAVEARVVATRVSGRRALFATTATRADTGDVVVDGVAMALLPAQQSET